MAGVGSKEVRLFRLSVARLIPLLTKLPAKAVTTKEPPIAYGTVSIIGRLPVPNPNVNKSLFGEFTQPISGQDIAD